MPIVTTSTYDKQFSYKLAILIVLLSYLIIYLMFLWGTNFLPYVFDNNETFSSLIHAKNIFHFGIKSSFGLSDESYGLLKIAHPYVYTHQGNFPRIYSLLLYCLGIKSAESQIAVTTFTIGLAGMLFCYHYFAKYISCFFAAIFCLLLMTDYVMFMQWQVNTWRVWHLFFFFASFLCCHGLNSINRKIFIPLTILNYTCLFYMEIAYAAFVFLSNSIYILLLPNICWKRKTLNIAIFSMGLLFGAGILISQNIAYLGWEYFKQDLIYTYSARNNLANPIAIKKVVEFFTEHKIVFWENFNYTPNIKNPVLILRNFYRYCLLPYTPFLTLTALIVMLNTALSYILTQKYSFNHIIAKYKHKLTLKSHKSIKISFMFIILILLILNLFKNDTLIIFLSSIILLGVGLFCLYIITKKITKILSHLIIIIKIPMPMLVFLVTIYFVLLLGWLTMISYPVGWGIEQRFDEFTKAISLASILFLGIIIYGFLPQKNEGRVTPVIAVFGYLIFLTFLSCVLYYLTQYNSNLAVTFQQKNSIIILGGTSAIPFIIGAIIYISIPILSSDNLSLRSPSYNLEIFKKILPFLLSVSLGFICTYLLFAGYILSGYLYRYCCFTVFAHIILYAFFFYALSIRVYNSLSILRATSTRDNYLQLALSCFLLLIFVYLWFSIQCLYIKEFPPTDFGFVQLLKTKSLHHKTMVVNTYAAPFAFNGNTWAYYDPVFGNFNLNENKSITSINHIRFQRDLRYLWLADAFINQEYQKPALFICWQGYNFEQLGQPKPTCENISLIKIIRNQQINNQRLTELAHDSSGRDRWSIIKLWNAPNIKQEQTTQLIINLIKRTQPHLISYSHRIIENVRLYLHGYSLHFSIINMFAVRTLRRYKPLLQLSKLFPYQADISTLYLEHSEVNTQAVKCNRQ